jgi:hypothetical protein
MSEDQPPPEPKRRVSYEPIRFGAGGRLRGAGAMIYGGLAAFMAALGVYMAAVEGHPLASPYVAGPAIGALWFGLRLFMMLSSRK